MREQLSSANHSLQLASQIQKAPDVVGSPAPRGRWPPSLHPSGFQLLACFSTGLLGKILYPALLCWTGMLRAFWGWDAYGSEDELCRLGLELSGQRVTRPARRPSWRPRRGIPLTTERAFLARPVQRQPLPEAGGVRQGPCQNYTGKLGGWVSPSVCPSGLRKQLRTSRAGQRGSKVIVGSHTRVVADSVQVPAFGRSEAHILFPFLR